MRMKLKLNRIHPPQQQQKLLLVLLFLSILLQIFFYGSLSSLFLYNNNNNNSNSINTINHNNRNNNDDPNQLVRQLHHNHHHPDLNMHHQMLSFSPPRGGVAQLRVLNTTTSTTNSTKKQKSCHCVRCQQDKNCGNLWYAGASSTPIIAGRNEEDDIVSLLLVSNYKLRLVVSHCTHNLTWMTQFINGYETQIIELIIISKCNQPILGIPSIRKMSQSSSSSGVGVYLNATIIRLPNVGRCDHSHAYYLARYRNNNNNNVDAKEIVIFLKDERNDQTANQPGRWRSLHEMLRIIASTSGGGGGGGFACGMELRRKKHIFLSAYHDSTMLSTFTMKNYISKIGRTGITKYSDSLGLLQEQPFKSKFSNMKEWVQSLGPDAKFPIGGITQVCYGGSFAVTKQQIFKISYETYTALEISLSRGNNIEEGHFAERFWATLLSIPLEDYQITALKEASIGISLFNTSILGALTYIRNNQRNYNETKHIYMYPNKQTTKHKTYSRKTKLN